jgi:hypothetical protein
MSDSQEFDAVVKLHEYAAPVKLMEPHPFLLVKGNRFCGQCGGGILHPIHRLENLPKKEESRV